MSKVVEDFVKDNDFWANQTSELRTDDIEAVMADRDGFLLNPNDPVEALLIQIANMHRSDMAHRNTLDQIRELVRTNYGVE
jgi:hypothetical protein